MPAIPASPVVIPDFAGPDAQDRGALVFHKVTKSTLNDVNEYVAPDACDQDAYLVMGIATSINELIDCTPVQQATGSVSLRLPADATAADVTLLMNFLRDQVIAQSTLLAP